MTTKEYNQTRSSLTSLPQTESLANLLRCTLDDNPYSSIVPDPWNFREEVEEKRDEGEEKEFQAVSYGLAYKFRSPVMPTSSIGEPLEEFLHWQGSCDQRTMDKVSKGFSDSFFKLSQIVRRVVAKKIYDTGLATHGDADMYLHQHPDLQTGSWSKRRFYEGGAHMWINERRYVMSPHVLQHLNRMSYPGCLEDDLTWWGPATNSHNPVLHERRMRFLLEDVLATDKTWNFGPTPYVPTGCYAWVRERKWADDKPRLVPPFTAKKEEKKVVSQPKSLIPVPPPPSTDTTDLIHDLPKIGKKPKIGEPQSPSALADRFAQLSDLTEAEPEPEVNLFPSKAKPLVSDIPDPWLLVTAQYPTIANIVNDQEMVEKVLGSMGALSMLNMQGPLIRKGRDVPIVMGTYTLPKVKFFGWRLNKLVDEVIFHSNDVGFHYIDAEVERVVLPIGLVEELFSCSLTVPHDDEGKLHRFLVARCTTLCKKLAFKTAGEEATAMLYAPIAAIHSARREVQNSSRLASGDVHIDLTRGGKIGLAGVGVTAFSMGGVIPGVVLPVMAAVGAAGAAVTGVALAAGVVVGIGLAVAATKKLFKYVARKVSPAQTLPDYAVPDLHNLDSFKGQFVYNTMNSVVHIWNMEEGAKVKEPVRLPSNEYQVQPVVELVGIGMAGITPVVFATNLHNERQAIRTRIVPYMPAAEFVTKIMFRRWVFREAWPVLSRNMKNIQAGSVEDYVKNSNSKPALKKILLETWERMKVLGEDNVERIEGKRLDDILKRSLFIKKELLPIATKFGISDKKPRPIQSAQPEYINLVGPWIAAFQKAMTLSWGTDFPILFSSGVHVEKVAEHVLGVPGCILEDDFGLYDVSIKRFLLLVEYEWYRKAGMPLALVNLMNKGIGTRGRSSHGIKYKVDGGRHSGDPNTSCGNSLINVLVHLYVYCKHFKYTVTHALSQIRMSVCGDDNVLKGRGVEDIDWKERMEELGLRATPKIHLPENAHHVEFCSMRLIPGDLFEEDGTWRECWSYTPKLARTLAKIPYCLNRRHGITKREQARSAVDSLYELTALNPGLRAYCDKIKYGTRDVQSVVPMQIEKWKMIPGRAVRPNARTWECLTDLYGYNELAHAQFVEALDKANMETYIDNPQMEHWMDVDECGPSRDELGYGGYTPVGVFNRITQVGTSAHGYLSYGSAPSN